SAELDGQLIDSKLSSDQQFLIAHATRSYYGNTQLLDVAGEPFWVVNEGERRLINSLDVAVDHVFWELQQNPWVVRNLLDNFARHYSYYDEVKVPLKRQERPQGTKTRRHEGAAAAATALAPPAAGLQSAVGNRQTEHE